MTLSLVHESLAGFYVCACLSKLRHSKRKDGGNCFNDFAFLACSFFYYRLVVVLFGKVMCIMLNFKHLSSNLRQTFLCRSLRTAFYGSVEKGKTQENPFAVKVLQEPHTLTN